MAAIRGGEGQGLKQLQADALSHAVAAGRLARFSEFRL